VAWFFADVFIVVVSIGISTRFQQLYLRITNAKHMVSFMERIKFFLNQINGFQFQLATEVFWMEIRNNYIRILDIVEMANTHFSVIIFVACFNNFYFVCFQVVGLTRLVVFFWCGNSSS
jgi:gustatory receptor